MKLSTEFGISRADASIPYTLCMLGFGFGGMWLGRWADRFGIARVLAISAAIALRPPGGATCSSCTSSSSSCSEVIHLPAAGHMWRPLDFRGLHMINTRDLHVNVAGALTCVTCYVDV
jgi:MFS family permease